ncbi:MAG: aconitate hydratase AcnA [candidate division KSB1 bacterium]|nr:aconitate hydratase AcnA [candidate division KSB1 bacterium]
MERKAFEAELRTSAGVFTIYSLPKLEDAGLVQLQRLPFSVRVLLENQLRSWDGRMVTEADVRTVAAWGQTAPEREIPFMPARVILQDFTGVPAIVDLAAMRAAVARANGDPRRINPIVPADLIIDHSVQVDFYGTDYALPENMRLEIERNRERYQLLKWAQRAFDNLRIFPPGTGIIHQVNVERLAAVVQVRAQNGARVAFPDTVVGTDSHTTMVNGLGVLGWGVGGIEAEAVMLGQPYYMLLPEVVGVRLVGELREEASATDLVLVLTELLRKKGVVGKFVEFCGPGLDRLSLPDRATLANMAPEYGATVGFFPVDGETLEYLRMTGRPAEQVELVERYCKEQGLFREPSSPEPAFSEVLELDLSTVEPTVAGPRRPHERVALKELHKRFHAALRDHFGVDVPEEDHARWTSEGGAPADRPAEARKPRVPIVLDGEAAQLSHGSVVIAAITSCTNTSNPSVMLGAGLLAKKAVERGLRVRPWVKTTLAPGSRVVTDYLRKAGLLPYLEALRFHVVGYGCTTCIGNSGPLREELVRAIKDNGLVVAAVLSGNRNFEARVHPLARANYLASPMLVVAYAIAGTVDIDLLTEPLDYDPNGRPVYLKDIWPTKEEIRQALQAALDTEVFRREYALAESGDAVWQALEAPSGDLYVWEASSTYIQEPPFFREFSLEASPPTDIHGARVLALLGDSVTTDHISPAGSIPPDGPAGRFLISHGVKPADFNTFGARRGNHEVMMRGTFANVRLRNLLLPGVEGGWTVFFPTGEKMSIYEAAMRYQEQGTPLVVVAGKEYGSGSSRDWAAKGTQLLGVKAVLAESFERIHRSNLVGMGVLPLQFEAGQNRETLGLDGTEVYSILGIAEGLTPRKKLTVRAEKADGSVVEFVVQARLDSQVEIEYYYHGGILPAVLRKILRGEG